MLKDDPALPAHLQPTRENIVSFLRSYVSVRSTDFWGVGLRDL